jgi:hypothetical protein
MKSAQHFNLVCIKVGYVYKSKTKLLQILVFFHRVVFNFNQYCVQIDAKNVKV